jgi:uncharacterized membrane protein YqjE
MPMGSERDEGAADAKRDGRGGGLFGSVRRLGQNLLGAVQTRLEILSTDIAYERFNLVRLVLTALGVLFCFQVGVFLAVLFVVLSVSNEQRLMAIGIAALVLLLGAGVGTLLIRYWLKHRRPFFAATIAELRKDRDRVGGGS